MSRVETPTEPHLVLASGSPRRREILEHLGFRFEIRPADIDESPLPGEVACEYVLRLARSKAAASARSDRARPGEMVLAADTIVVLDGDLLGKPADGADARQMLLRLAGCHHEVLTGVALQDLSRHVQVSAVETTKVFFSPMSEEEIAAYVEGGEPMDKAGAYAIQGMGGVFVDRVEGNYSNVVGLPLPMTYRLLARAGFPVPISLSNPF